MVTEGPLTAAQIYEQVTGGTGSDSLASAQDGAIDLTNRMVERAQRISALRTKTMSGWQGGAGDSAADATLPLVRAASDDAVHLKTAQDAVGAQMDAFGTAKNSVKPVPPQAPKLGADDVVNALNGQGWDSYHTKVARWQADSQANIDAFSAYHSASTSNGGQMPAQYAQLADSGAPVSMNEGTTPKNTGPTDTGEWARKPQQPDVPAQQDRRNRPIVPSTPDQVRNQTTSQTQNQFQNPVQLPGTADQTHADSYVLPPVAHGGYEFGPTGQPVSNLGGNSAYGSGFGPGGYNAGGYGTGVYGGNGPGSTGKYGQGTPGAGGSGPGTPGAGGTRGYGTGGTNQPAPRNPTDTRAPGAGTGARLPEERLPNNPANRGTAGPRGANGMPLGTPMNNRGKEEDREKKKAPYLQNPDPDETFGGFTEKPMPPVIGEKRTKQ